MKTTSLLLLLSLGFAFPRDIKAKDVPNKEAKVKIAAHLDYIDEVCTLTAQQKRKLHRLYVDKIEIVKKLSTYDGIKADGKLMHKKMQIDKRINTILSKEQDRKIEKDKHRRTLKNIKGIVP